MEQHPGAGLSISQLLFALEREVDDVTNKRRSDDYHIPLSLKLTTEL
jgi:hypothetical protein